MDIYDLKELESLLKEYLSCECLDNYFIKDSDLTYSEEKLEKLEKLNNKTNSIIECLKHIKKSIEEN